jgi:3-deoxy-D-manno-octulosonate 8-phosphate phosphatase (KDO 8-P phosphatase)
VSDDLLASIEALVMDVDGVLTDGAFFWSTGGEEFKRFSFEDVMGASRALQAGLKLGLISGEDSALVDLIAKKMGIVEVTKGCKEKGVALRRFADTVAIPLVRIAFMGDDVNDLPALAIAGLSVAPANAQPQVKAAVQLVLERGGGQGAARQLIEMILAARARRAPPV